MQYASLPYSLYPRCHDRSSEGERRKVAQALLAERVEDLDPYSDGIRFLYPTGEALMSDTCRATLRVDFMGRRLSLDLTKLVHAEVKHWIPTRAPALNFPNLDRECIMAQAAIVHVGRGATPSHRSP